MSFKIHVLKLLIMIVRMLMDAKIQATGSNYEFQGERAYLNAVEGEIRDIERKAIVDSDSEG